MAFGLTVHAEDREGVKILRIDGRLDAASTPILEKKLAEHIEDAGKIALDFSRVDYLSSAGMRLLLSVTKKMKARKGQIVFFSLGEDVMEIIKMAGFERILPIYSKETDALKALGTA